MGETMNALIPAYKRAVQSLNGFELSEELATLIRHAAAEFKESHDPMDCTALIAMMYHIGVEHSIGGSIGECINRVSCAIKINVQTGNEFPDDLKYTVDRIMMHMTGAILLGISSSWVAICGGLLAAYCTGLEAGKGTEHAAMYATKVHQ